MFWPREGLRASVLEHPFAVTELSFIHLGQEVTLDTWDNRWRLVFFGYSRCPDVCPITMAHLAQFYQGLTPKAQQDIQVIMISVDPADTAEVIQNYAQGFDQHFVGLTGSASQIAQAAKSFFVGYQQLPDEQFSHTEALFVVDPEGLLRFIYNSDNLRYLASDWSKW
ncbi:MAG: SCO family protein [Deinococcales bacterium]